MGQTDYRWDIEELNQQITRLQREYDTLSGSRNFMSTLKGEVQEAWESIAGSIYEGNLEVDLENYDQILKELQESIRLLDKIANTCYQDCEDSIRKRAAQLQSCISPI